MRSLKTVIIALLAVVALTVMPGDVVATGLIGDTNLFSGHTPVVSGSYGIGTPANLTDGLGGTPLPPGVIGDFFFGPKGADQIMVVNDISSAVKMIRIWSGSDLFPGGIVEARSSSTAGLGLGGTFETLLGSIPYSSSIATWTDSLATSGGQEMYYKDLLVNAPVNTKSIRINFGPERYDGPNAGWGSSRMSEVQAFAATVFDNNVLRNQSVAVSSNYENNGSSGTFGSSVNAMNGHGGGPNGDFIWNPGDPQQRMVIHGFDSTLGLIRIWSGSDRPPVRVAIKSSTTDINPTSEQFADGQTVGGLFSTTIHDMADISSSAWIDSGLRDLDSMELYYYDVAVNAPTNTKSLYFDFGAGGGYGGSYGNWARISEIQAFAIPEPGTLVLLAAGMLSLLAYAWRKRR